MHADAPRTIRALLQKTTPWLQARGSSSARLDTELLIGHALGLRRIDLYMDLDKPLSEDELERCRALVKRRGTGEPVAYILGAREFCGLSFAVDKAVLIPRPETELLVELALARLPVDDEATVIDVGTGSGCIAIALLHARKKLKAVAVDVSAAALEVAKKNAAHHGVADRLSLRQGDLLGPCDDVKDAALIVSNPPYVVPGSALLDPAVKAHEPSLALFGEGTDGLGIHRRLVEAAPRHLRAGGALVMELGSDQGDAARALGGAKMRVVGVERDLDGLDRLVVLALASSGDGTCRVLPYLAE